MAKRRTPIRHKVRSHKREGKKVKSFTRGRGSRRRVNVRVDPVGKNISKPKPPTEEELAERDRLWGSHREMVQEKDPLALRMQDILEKCYPPDPKVRGYRWDEMYQKWRDLHGALMEIGPISGGWKSLPKVSAAFKKWGVEEALYCEALKDIFVVGYKDEWKKWR